MAKLIIHCFGLFWDRDQIDFGKKGPGNQGNLLGHYDGAQHATQFRDQSGIYILYVEVTEDIFATDDRIARYDIYDENMKLVYKQDDVIYRAGEKMFSAGQSTFRKFVIIR